MKRSAAVLTIIFILFTYAQSCFADAADMRNAAGGGNGICALAESAPIEFSLTPVRYTDRNSGKLRTYFNGMLLNGGQTAIAAEIAATVTDKDGKPVWSFSDSITVNPNTVVYKNIMPVTDEDGIYIMEGTAVCGGQSFAISETFLNGAANDKLGVCTHFGLNRGIKNSDLYTVRQGGIGWIRDECFWKNVEKTKGEYKIPQTFMDTVNFACDNGIDMLLVLDYGNELYMNVYNPVAENYVDYFPETDEQIEAYANYCGYMARTLKGKVDHFEIWNEPNTKRFSGRKLTADEYVKVLRAAYNAIKEANPDACVLGGCVTSGAKNDDNDTMCNDFLRGLFKDDVASKHMDALSIHPYILDPQVPADSKEFSFANMDFIKDVMGDYAVPIWITEVGYANANSDVKNALTEEQQGAYSVRSAIHYGADSKVEKIFLYEFIDKGSDLTALTYNYGMLKTDKTPKASYRMLSFANSLIGGMKFGGKAVEYGSNKNQYVGYSFYKFSDNDKDVIVMWTNGGAEYSVNAESGGGKFTAAESGGTVSLNIAAAADKKYLSAYDSYGNVIDMSELKIDYRPKYIVCRKEPPAVYDAECAVDVNFDKVSINGRTQRGLCPVALRVTGVGNDAYIDQTLSGEDGNYSFDFTVGKRGIYLICVNDTQSLRSFTEDIDRSRITFFKNDVPVTDITDMDIHTGDVITAKLEFNGALPQGVKFIGAAFEGENHLGEVVQSSIVNKDGEAAAELEIKVKSENVFLRFFLWDDNMKPLINGKRVN